MTKLIIINGYAKNDRAWSENSRVKTLELLVNGATRGFLRLKDSAAVQEFKVGPFYPSHEHPAYTVRLVIRDVYLGTKYQDTAISEIDLDGVDVHCVAGDTSIRMPGGGTKKISELAAGDRITIAKFPGGAVSSAPVIRLVKTFHDEVYSYAPDSAHRILVTADHLFIGADGRKKTVKDIPGSAVMKGKNRPMYTIVIGEKEEAYFSGNGIWLKAEK
jgi:hypothetical protein